MRGDDITALGAVELSNAIHARQVSCREVMQAYLDRIQRLNLQFNAIVSAVPEEQALAEADARDAELAAGVGGRRGRGGQSGPGLRTGSRGWMHGMPQAIKDTGHAAGLPTTWGSPIYARHVAASDSVHVQRMKSAGAIVIGKTNMPEFGLGSHTYNPLFGRTPNAWDATRSAGGSSGGAAVALAQRMLPVADGSDFMGSLRNPAGWNHVFGLRPSQGRVPGAPKPEMFISQLGTDGPMGRSVRDLAALLTTQAGYDARAPLALETSPTSFVPGARAGDTGLKGKRIAWLADLDGHLPMESGILAVCEAALARMASAGAVVEPAALGFPPEALWDAWLIWRRALVAPAVAAALAIPGATREQVKPEALWEHDQAAQLSFNTFMQAAQVRSDFHRHLLTLFERYDALALPVAQVWPFDLQWDWPREVAGRTMDTYHRWMEVTLYATFAGLPAISVPAGFEASGHWPMGLQLIGAPRGDAALLAMAAAYEARSAQMLARRPA
jgi:amidase